MEPLWTPGAIQAQKGSAVWPKEVVISILFWHLYFPSGCAVTQHACLWKFRLSLNSKCVYSVSPWLRFSTWKPSGPQRHRGTFRRSNEFLQHYANRAGFTDILGPAPFWTPFCLLWVAAGLELRQRDNLSLSNKIFEIMFIIVLYLFHFWDPNMKFVDYLTPLLWRKSTIQCTNPR